ncbi:C4-dicarboxylate-binding periplasmic protein precursor [Thalassovita gelatinovora]|uniref:C4-dicarboxylate-binding periplasmic protein n=1 Tax=Thalassovita gelatinovora TaxID=53501 RepID=A0A0P1FAY7_THAGE|nr:TRAP transporter substrate-binding protein [Thalassovita gelatinovora]QIZ80720.1 TRAP transporter substrate-binding protein [Thalassovita gelatinovora]CUH65326.1 C4-dicarboxylate-binding periplasmic protein precursor [Thalassovita gelatinovora]SEQ89394.1 TRAP-type C4-dicarboxylate transport system, substrate-binding protein [Thalassovita gelatinovora]
MKKLLSTVAATMILSGVANAETTLTVANWLPPSHPLVSEVIVPMTEQIKEATAGEVVANILPAPLGPPPAHFDFAVNGVADITFGVQGYTAGRFKTTNIAEIPFLGDSAEAISVAYWRTFEAMLKDAGEYDDVKVLGVFTHGPGEIFLKKGDASAVDLLDGKKLRVGGGIVHEVASTLGAVPVEGPSSKAYELLSQGVADGILFPYESVSFFKLIPQLSVGVSVPGGLYNTSFYIVMNKAKWDSLTPEQQTAIDSVTGEALARMAGQMWDRVDAAGLEAMAGQTTVTPATEEQVTAWTEALQPVVDAKLAEVSETGVDGAAALAMLKAEIAAVAAEQ